MNTSCDIEKVVNVHGEVNHLWSLKMSRTDSLYNPPLTE